MYALGGRTFSFSVLERTDAGGQESHDARWTTLAAARTPEIGGEAFDVAVVDSLVRSAGDRGRCRARVPTCLRSRPCSYAHVPNCRHASPPAHCLGHPRPHASIMPL